MGQAPIKVLANGTRITVVCRMVEMLPRSLHYAAANGAAARVGMTKQAREKSRTQSGVTVPLGAARRGRRALQELLAEVAPVVEFV